MKGRLIRWNGLLMPEYLFLYKSCPDQRMQAMQSIFMLIAAAAF
jgi:hypothetical protein